ncbi:hypothetical protein [Acinetobacter populi]|uniref:Uncharacterized protein n=1 Tax=Acinetobacter populi TaxID=1582270 RepID=A0A1Z9Z3Q5_9GAMM|nr:hypothetical protein [Acinetobacter populi]OUY09069.1 hypothetical protein CAP51_05570 [Acinetobacter populi]
MKNKVYYVLPIVTFALGFFIADVRMVSQNLNEYQDSSLLSSLNHNMQKNKEEALSSLTLDNTSSAQKVNQLSKEYKQEVLAMIDEMPEQQVQKYLQQAFPNQDLKTIQNKKVFAQNVLQELTSQNDEEKLAGTISVAFTPVYSQQSENVSQVHRYQGLFAHFDTYGKFPNNEQIFIRWLNRDTGELIVFTPKRISKDENQNWISVIPDQGWQEGTYDVKVYQMNDALTPIAQTSYTLLNVLD